LFALSVSAFVGFVSLVASFVETLGGRILKALLRPVQSFARALRLGRKSRRFVSPAACGVLAAALSGCVAAPPPGVILSRLAPGQPGAAKSARPLSAEEQKRYADIDKQVTREQNEAISAREWARYYTPYYYSAPVTFGGYYGGWSSGWGVSYYSPGYYPGYYPGWWW
jgi:hypothetical protein